MDNFWIKVFVLTLIVSCCFFAVYIALFRPFLLNNVTMLGAIVFLQLLLAAIWKYRQRFFLVLIIAFLWAGASVPMQGAWATGRWVVLGVGAIAGFFLYLKEHWHHFGPLHMAALFCVIAALVSALVSDYPKVALLKTISLLLLFLYAASGARLAIVGREAKFFSGLLVGCEVLVYVTAVAYLALHSQLYGNKNSLGVVMGVIVLPILLWGFIISERPIVYQRRGIELMLCIFLLFSSYARAAIAASVISSLVLCVLLRRFRLLVRGVGLALLVALLVVSTVPLPSSSPSADNSLTTRFLYKGKRETGVLGSRSPVWDKTVASLRVHPWFGTGFGTSATDYDETTERSIHVTSDETYGGVREHGNSYLAIIEWVGLLGVAPFILLLSLTVWYLSRVVIWMYRTANPYSPAVPIAAFALGALVHAGFEDWLFAVGYYACIFFWALVFSLPDLMPAGALQPAHTLHHIPRPSNHAADVAVPGR